MNNTFDFNRFSLLVKRQWVENRKLYLMGVLTLLGLGIVIHSLGTDWVEGNFMLIQVRVVLFFFSFFLGGTLFTNYIFKDLSDKNSSTSFLLIPASHLEKQLSMSIYVFIVFPIIYLMLYYVIDHTFVNIANGLHNGLVGKTLNPNKYLFDFLKESESQVGRLAILIPAWFAVQSFVILGSISFMGWSYIKTGFAGFIILFVIALLVIMTEKLLLDDLSNELGSSNYSQIKPTKDMIDGYVMFGFQYVITPLLLVITYFKLKEKQV
jgi:hypothetical protein